VRYSVASLEALRTYLDVLDRETEPDVARGGEFCWHDSLWRELPDDVVRRFTHRIGSLHAAELPGGERVHMFQRTFPSGLAPGEYMEHHVACVERLAAEMPVDVFAHPTLLPIPLRGLPLEELWTEALEARAVEALWRAGIAFEISNRYRPHERFVRRAADRGVRISLGSDGHTRAQVGDIAAPLAMARAAGVRDEELYDPLVYGSRTLG
jgi:histidinol phosphatase-like PHP family hydrolase